MAEQHSSKYLDFTMAIAASLNIAIVVPIFVEPMDTAETISPIDTRPKKLRSAVSNGSRPMLGSDGRGMWVRRYKDLIEDHANCYGGVNHLSVPRMSLLRRQAAALVECELIEARMSAGEATPDDIDRHTRIVGNIRRCYEALGMDHIARPVSNVIIEHFASPGKRTP